MIDMRLAEKIERRRSLLRIQRRQVDLDRIVGHPAETLRDGTTRLVP